MIAKLLIAKKAVMYSQPEFGGIQHMVAGTIVLVIESTFTMLTGLNNRVVIPDPTFSKFWNVLMNGRLVFCDVSPKNFKKLL